MRFTGRSLEQEGDGWSETVGALRGNVESEGDESEVDSAAGEMNAKPVSPAQVKSVIAEPADLSCPEPGALNGLRLIVVDNHADTRELLRVLLEDCGARVVTAATAQEALDTIKTDRPDLLVTEIELPRQDGYDLLRELRALPGGGAEIPAITLTTRAREADRRRALSAGFREHITKPVDPAALVGAIVDVTGRAPRRAPD